MRYLSFSLLLLFIGTVCHADSSETLVDTGFGQNTQLISDRDNASGLLPEGVFEDSAWADVQIEYSLETDVLGGVYKWIRATVSELKSGRAQLKWKLPDSTENAQYRLTVNSASTTGSRVSFQVSQLGAPYTVFWQEAYIPEINLGAKTFDFALPPVSEPIGLILAMEQEGEYDLGSVTLVRRSSDEVAKARQAAIDSAPVNLAPNAGFALGLPTAWRTNLRYSIKDAVRFEPASQASAYGTVPLRIDVVNEGEGAYYDLYSSPFNVPDPKEIYILSFIASGENTSGRVEVYTNGAPAGSGSYETTPEGTLVKIPFRVDELARWNVIHWSGTEDVQIDALNVSLGRQALPFQFPGEVELALAADFEKGNVFVEGVDSPEIRYALSGALQGDLTLKSRTVNLYGQTAEGEPIMLSEDNATGSITPVLPDASRTYGSYRFEAWIERAGEPISPITETVYHVVPKPHYWGQIAPESKFGHHINIYEPHLYAVKAIGSNWARFHARPGDITTYWSAVEPEKGQWTWHDDNVNRYREAGFATMGVLVKTPYWARPERAEARYNGWLDNWWQPRDYAEFGEYVSRAVTHHKDNIDAWMVWNEAWGEFWFKEWRPELGPIKQWHHGDTPLEDFNELSRVAWEAFKETGIDKPFLSINGTLGERGKKWMRDSIEVGTHEYGNGISYHAYFGGSLKDAINENNGMLENLQRRVFDPIQSDPDASKQPIWMTEGTWLMLDWTTGMHYHSIPGKKDPLAVVREKSITQPLYHAIHLAHGAEKVFTYAINAGPAYYKELAPGEHNWGSIVTQGGELHPAGVAYAAMAQRFDPATFNRRIQATPTRVAFVFDNPDGSSFMAVFDSDSLNDTLTTFEEAGLNVTDFLGNPAQADIRHQLLYIDLGTERAEELLDVSE